MRSLGADHVIDYAQDDFTKTGRQYDFILDLIADRSIFAYARALKRGGKYYAVGGSLGTFLPILMLGRLFGRVTKKYVRVLIVRRNRQDLAYVTELCQSGKLVPAIDRTYRLEQVPEALRQLGNGDVKGKAVIIVDDAI
jgi:NADPH:quinone reductase-like Zn-dependent oxidoreductase